MTLATFGAAWADALYGPNGFYRRERPVDHFRTSVHASPLFADALARIARDRGLTAVVDLGSGDGELLARIDAGYADEFDLLGVDLRPRPRTLPAAVGWSEDLPASFDGLLVANEYLDDVPCDVIEVDEHGVARVVLVDAMGAETLGDPYEAPWLERWWPLTEPGARAEVGVPRDDAWADAVARIGDGVAIAVDYGHIAGRRPPYGSVRAYAGGRETDVRLDGTCDVTAHVAVDAVAARVGGTLRRQRDVLSGLEMVAGQPPLALATTEPAAYVRALARASQAAELTEAGGLGDHWWVVSEHGRCVGDNP